ncbi:MAG: Tol-Pal system beta propeller repeat protein TolB [Candidatus Hydrogenedentes bacterium]|nr:Tol-Pal system beta propeller repeat protein TolB [Candidatus Hydrogenedentota bacterium]
MLGDCSFRVTILFLTVILLSLGINAQDAIRIGSVRGVDVRILVAVPPFCPDTADLTPVATEMAQVFAYDLDFSGLFILLPREQYPMGFVGLERDVNAINFDAWRATKAEFLVYGFVKREGNQYVCQFRLIDLVSKSQVVGKEVRVEVSHPRLAPHRFSEEVIAYVDGIPGIGTSQICFNGIVGGKKEIFISDYDGANLKQITEHGSISIKPKFSPDGTKIAYLSYKDRYSFLYIYDRLTGRVTPLSKEVGLNASPAWFPDSRRLAMTLSKDANMEIYIKDIDGKNPVRVTKNQYGDSSPTISPDGTKMAFVSDRGGSPQIYVMGVDGSDVRRVSYQGGNSYDPVWSPDGKMIAYVVEQKGEGFEIYVMNADGSEPRRLTNSYGSNESPTWSPDSRHIMFCSNRNGSWELWTVNVKTGEERKVPNINIESQGPSWGPRASKDAK